MLFIFHSRFFIFLFARDTVNIDGAIVNFSLMFICFDRNKTGLNLSVIDVPIGVL